MINLSALGLGLILSATNAFSTVPCYDSNPGWGLGPGAIGVTCRADRLGDAARAVKYFEDHSLDGNDFTDPNTSADILRDYTDHILDLVEQIAIDFYNERTLLENRKASPAELQGWVDAVTAVAFQESYLTHYQFDRRTGDKAHRLNILVGDGQCAVRLKKNTEGRLYCPRFSQNADGARLYHAQGMYQINLNAHSSSSKNNFFDLVQNIQYGMAFYYLSWIQIIQNRQPNMAACRRLIVTKNGINYKNAARAAYSVYNGGPAKVCRWQTNSVWRHNDDGYQKAVENRPWFLFSSDIIEREKRKIAVRLPDGKIIKRYAFRFDLSCLRRAGENCLIESEKPQSFSFASQLSLQMRPVKLARTAEDEAFARDLVSDKTPDLQLAGFQMLAVAGESEANLQAMAKAVSEAFDDAVVAAGFIALSKYKSEAAQTLITEAFLKQIGFGANEQAVLAAIEKLSPFLNSQNIIKFKKLRDHLKLISEKESGLQRRYQALDRTLKIRTL